MYTTSKSNPEPPVELRVRGWHRLGALEAVARAELVGPYGFLRSAQLVVLSSPGTRAATRAARTRCIRAATHQTHPVIQSIQDVLATPLGDIVLSGLVDGYTVEELLERNAPVPLSAAYAIALDLADAALVMAEHPEAAQVAIRSSDVVLQSDGRVRLLNPALLHVIGGRPLASGREVGRSIVELLYELLRAAGVEAPERALRTQLGHSPSLEQLYEVLSAQLFDSRHAYERRCVGAIVQEFLLRPGSGVHRVAVASPERAPEERASIEAQTLLAWSA